LEVTFIYEKRKTPKLHYSIPLLGGVRGGFSLQMKKLVLADGADNTDKSKAPSGKI